MRSEWIVPPFPTKRPYLDNVVRRWMRTKLMHELLEPLQNGVRHERRLRPLAGLEGVAIAGSPHVKDGKMWRWHSHMGLLLPAAARLPELEGDHNLPVQALSNTAGEHAVGHAQVARAHIHPGSAWGTQDVDGGGDAIGPTAASRRPRLLPPRRGRLRNSAEKFGEESSGHIRLEPRICVWRVGTRTGRGALGEDTRKAEARKLSLLGDSLQVSAFQA